MNKKILFSEVIFVYAFILIWSNRRSLFLGVDYFLKIVSKFEWNKPMVQTDFSQSHRFILCKKVYHLCLFRCIINISCKFISLLVYFIVTIYHTLKMVLCSSFLCKSLYLSLIAKTKHLHNPSLSKCTSVYSICYTKNENAGI